MASKGTRFQGLSRLFNGGSNQAVNYTKNVRHNYNISDDEIIFKTDNPEIFKKKALELKQQTYLAKAWRRSAYSQNINQAQNLPNVQMMYREADLMDGFPEIGTAMDIIMEECCYQGDTGFIVNVMSKSERIKSILQDLLVNRLSITTTLPMVCRSAMKYGNCFMMLNIGDADNGVMGWRELPVYEMQRFENGMDSPYSQVITATTASNLDSDGATKFVQVGSNVGGGQQVYRNWQVAHFRLLYNSIFLPYGCSFLNKARRHFRMLSMAEDMMLMYRLERSVERRVYKVDVGAIDEQDVPAYIEEVANEFKRTPVFDPLTGQLDLRKATWSTFDDVFVPVRDPSQPNPIETLQGGQNLTAMDDIKFLQNKVLTALRVPKSFLNFEDEKGDGKNLSLLDVRFTRTVNRIQQMLIMELNKVCIIHLYLLGLTDDLTNFTLTMNNPSSQSEMLQLENLGKKIDIVKNAITDNGNGIPIMSLTRALQQVMGWSKKEIQENLEEIRLEKALATELELTPQIIKRTGIFDAVDNIYGEPGAEYKQNQEGSEGGDDGMGGGGGGGLGGGLDFGGGDDMGDMGGADGEVPMDDTTDDGGGDMDGAPDMGGEDNADGAPDLAEALIRHNTKKLLNEKKRIEEVNKKKIKHYTDLLLKRNEEKENLYESNIPLLEKTFLINEELNSISKELCDYKTKKSKEMENIEKDIKKTKK